MNPFHSPDSESPPAGSHSANAERERESPERILTILVLTGDQDSARFIRSALAGLEGVRTEVMSSVQEGIERVRRERLDVTILDEETAEVDPFEALQTLRSIRPEPVVIIWSRRPSVERAVRAIRLGAADCLAKEAGPDAVRVAIERARQVRELALRVESAAPAGGLPERWRARGIVGSSGEIRRLHEQIDRRAAEDGWVLIVGERGTGKELTARALHASGPRASGPFIAFLPAGARREDLERELADASNGILYIDDVAALPPDLQAAVAGLPSSGARVVVSTSSNLPELVGRGLFHGGLFDRLSRSILAVPPLRDRKEDIPTLVRAFLRRRVERGVPGASSLAEDAIRTLSAYDWPGNVRELELAVDRACELGQGGPLERRHLPPEVIRGAERNLPREGTGSVTRSLREMESQVIRNLLGEHRGDTEAVARLLGIDRSTLYRKVKRYGIDLDRFRGGGE